MMIRKSLFTVPLLPVVMASLLGQVPAWAQDTSTEDTAEERWYEVEMIIFSQPRSQAMEREHWPTDIALTYPPNWVTLRETDEVLDENGEPLTLEQQAADQPLPTNAEATDADAVAEQLEGTLPTAFAVLDEEAYQLSNKANAIKRSRDRRLLLHKAWRQPMLDKDKAQSILISAGETYNSHQELEGSIQISVARYLHLNTNLWFTEYTHNYGQEATEWPPLPIRPDLRNFGQQRANGSSIESNQATGSNQGTETSNFKLNSFSQYDNNHLNGDTLTNTQWQSENNDAWQQIAMPETEYDLILKQEYLPKRISLIKQKRRMRSKELHYIDHPAVGILLLITPYELPINEPAPAETDEIAAG